jgi:hypothetical protein
LYMVTSSVTLLKIVLCFSIGSGCFGQL